MSCAKPIACSLALGLDAISAMFIVAEQALLICSALYAWRKTGHGP